MSAATDLSKLAPMAWAVLTTLPCSRTDRETDHEVDTRTGTATCVCGATQDLDSADLDALLED